MERSLPSLAMTAPTTVASNVDLPTALEVIDLTVTPEGPERPTEPTGPDRSRRRRRRRLRRRIVVLALVALLVPVGWSYAGYLTAPGDAPVSVRTDDWLRDHGFESLMNRVEQWWYTRSKPTGRMTATANIPTGFTREPKVADPLVISPQRVHQEGEGQWRAVPGLARGTHVEETFIRPDTRYPSVGVDLVRFDQASTRLVYVPGSKEPGGTWSWGSQIPTSARDRVLAAFNAGFKFRHTTGGIYTEGRHAVRPLANGLASLVVERNGRADIVAWHGGNHIPSGVVTVRQNLSLIVTNGREAAGLRTDRHHRWGTTNSQLQYTWRSALGVDGQGRLIYAAGPKMSLTELSHALIDAGAVRAMQLDIHDGVVTYNWYRDSSGRVSGTKLMPSMQRGATRYLMPDQRDFFVIEAR
jgi:hypothetical protein